MVFFQNYEGYTLKFKEKFMNNKNNWPTGASGKNYRTLDTDNQVLKISIYKKWEGAHSNIKTDIDFNKDFIVELELKPGKNYKNGGTPEAGIKFGDKYDKYAISGGGGYYSFKIKGNTTQVASIFCANKSGAKFFSSYKSDVTYNHDKFNKIAVQKSGDEIHFFLNGKKIYTNEATELEATEGMVSLEASFMQTAQFKSLMIYTKE